MSTAAIWSKSKPVVEIQLADVWAIQWHVILEPRATLQDERIPSAILKIVFRCILLCLVWALVNGGFRVVINTRVCL